MPSNAPYVVAAWNYLESFSAGDYVELIWMTNNTNVSIDHMDAGALNPAIPSIILTAQQVMYTQIGPTGPTGPIGPTGPSGVPTALNDLTDVSVSSPVSAQILKYNGSEWVNAPADGYLDSVSYTYTLTATTTNATETELTTNGLSPSGTSNRIIIAADSTSAFDIIVVARRTDANGEGAYYNIKTCLARNTDASSTIILGTDYKLVVSETTAGWEANASENTADGALKVSVVGEAGKTIKWVAFVRQLISLG